MTTILAVDPGGTTGYATFHVEQWLDPEQRAGSRTHGEASFEEFEDMAYNWLWSEYRRGVSVTVVCERFVIMPGTMTKSRSEVNWSIETIGLLRFLCRRWGHEFVTQGVGDAKGLATNDLLRRIGWWARGEDHGRDALRHLVLWLAGNRADVFKQLVSRT